MKNKNPNDWPANCKICDFALHMSIHDAQTPVGEIIISTFSFKMNINL